MAVIGIDHYHTTGWVQTLDQFEDELGIVALYDPDPAVGQGLRPRYHDLTLPAALDPKYRTCPFFTDLDALVRETHPDAALVTLPDAAAPSAIVQLARHGVHMLVDKPAARTAAQARAAFDAAAAAGVRVVVGLGRRYGRMYRDVREHVATGRLGRLICAEAIAVTSSVAVRDPRNYLFDPSVSGGGILHWLGIHDVDALCWLTGQHPVEVHAMTARAFGSSLQVEDVASVNIRFAQGGIGTIHCAYALPAIGGDASIALRGTAASVRIHPEGELTWLEPLASSGALQTRTERYDVPKVPGYGAAGLAMVRDLVGCIRGNGLPLAGGGDLVAALEVVDAAYRSAETGCTVRLGTVEPQAR